MTTSDQVTAALVGLPPLAGTIEEFVAAVAAQRGRPIVLTDLPATTKTGSLCGMWVPTQTTDHIFVAPNVSGPHRDHVVMHEVGHMLLGHRLGLLTSFTAVSPKLVLQMLARTTYSDPQEREAEQFASLVLARTHGTARGSWAHDPRLRRAATIFGG
jgi:Zn-dependent peptidase ImmA (M78 family)